MGMDIEVTRDVIATLIEEARRTGEMECCGLLLGEGDPARIAGALPTANVHPEPARHFEIDPVALIQAYRNEREGGPTLVGFYHSHPGGHPRPSANDCEHAGGDGRIWAIIARGEVHIWRDTRQGFVELGFRVVTA